MDTRTQLRGRDLKLPQQAIMARNTLPSPGFEAAEWASVGMGGHMGKIFSFAEMVNGGGEVRLGRTGGCSPN